jgi:hypothetical protein
VGTPEGRSLGRSVGVLVGRALGAGQVEEEGSKTINKSVSLVLPFQGGGVIKCQRLSAGSAGGRGGFGAEVEGGLGMVIGPLPIESFGGPLPTCGHPCGPYGGALGEAVGLMVGDEGRWVGAHTS